MLKFFSFFALVAVAFSGVAHTKEEFCSLLTEQSPFRGNHCWVSLEESGPELQCPRSSDEREDGSLKAVRGFFNNKFLPVILGKSTEILVLKNTELSKASAKAIGKMAKASKLSASDIHGIMACGASGFAAVHLAEAIRENVHGTHALASLAIAAVYADRLSEPEATFEANDGVLSRAYEAFDDWIADPLFWKTLRTGTRYAFEKEIQGHLNSMVAQTQVREYFAGLAALLSAQQIIDLSRAVPIGLSKIASSALLSVAISSMEIGFDLFRADPQYKTYWEQCQRIATDAAIGIGTTTLIAILLPTSIALLSPTVVICVFVVGGVIYFANIQFNSVQE